MAISKDQVLANGVFYPSFSQNTIFFCHVKNSREFLKNFFFFSFVIGLFSFFIVNLFSLGIIVISWPFLLIYLLPRYYRLIQINKHFVEFGKGSFLSLITQKKLLIKVKIQFKDLEHLRIEQWQQRKRNGKIDRFGRLEIKSSNKIELFRILITSSDASKLINVLEKYHFDLKVQKMKSKGEFKIIFPLSPLYSP